MIGTLQRYVTRELFKTFALTAVGLMLVFTLCGGVLNMIEAEVLSAVQLLRLVAHVLPISATLTLPISALYACAMVYGRLAADNEFDACRASGVNIHRLLLPAFLLSIFTASFTYTFSNHLIPGMIAELDAMVRKDLHKVVYHLLTTRGYGRHMGYVLHAGRTELEVHNENHQTLYIDQAAFIEFEDDRLARCGTAERAQIDFLTDPQTGTPTVQANLLNVRSLDVIRNQFMEFQEQPFDPVAIPMEQKLNPKWLTLPKLLYYQDNLVELPAIQRYLESLRRLVRRTQFFKYIHSSLTGPEGVFRIGDANVTYELRAKRVSQDLESLRPELHDVTVVETNADGTRRIYEAEGCRIDVERARGPDDVYLLSLRLLGQVTMQDADGPSDTAVVQRNWQLDRVVLPETIPGETTDLSAETLLGEVRDPASFSKELPTLGLGPRVDEARQRDRAEIIEAGLKIAGIIHSRLAFSAANLVILVLAAALGIVFRGGQLLTAFVISFVPGMVVVVMNIMGRQLMEKSGTHLTGMALIWGGLLLLAVADVVVLGRYLKR